ncbi:MAG: hypothetical protein MI919_14295 [Holophagales bacterium]|nr:hypothetical protein [Holophagales bacterium]
MKAVPGPSGEPGYRIQRLESEKNGRELEDLLRARLRRAIPGRLEVKDDWSGRRR